LAKGCRLSTTNGKKGAYAKTITISAQKCCLGIREKNRLREKGKDEGTSNLIFARDVTGGENAKNYKNHLEGGEDTREPNIVITERPYLGKAKSRKWEKSQ